jgi:hypothetical protein
MVNQETEKERLFNEYNKWQQFIDETSKEVFDMINCKEIAQDKESIKNLLESYNYNISFQCLRLEIVKMQIIALETPDRYPDIPESVWTKFFNLYKLDESTIGFMILRILGFLITVTRRERKRMVDRNRIIAIVNVYFSLSPKVVQEAIQDMEIRGYIRFFVTYKQTQRDLIYIPLVYIGLTPKGWDMFDSDRIINKY